MTERVKFTQVSRVICPKTEVLEYLNQRRKDEFDL